MERVLKYGAVFLISMFKFVLGPVSGVLSGLTVVESALLSSLGMMSSVILFALGGTAAREWWFTTFRHDRKLFSPRNRKIVRFWSRFGLGGLAFLTPVVFSPIVGTLLAVSFGADKNRIFRLMALASLFWGLVLALLVWLIRHGLNQIG